jgi:hypothetical protein
LCHDEVVKLASKNCDKFITTAVRIALNPTPNKGVCTSGFLMAGTRMVVSAAGFILLAQLNELSLPFKR